MCAFHDGREVPSRRVGAAEDRKSPLLISLKSGQALPGGVPAEDDDTSSAVCGDIIPNVTALASGILDINQCNPILQHTSVPLSLPGLKSA